jgi:murein DD-endopeptidase MepM/ murein hydrolase activator NlpD
MSKKISLLLLLFSFIFLQSLSAKEYTWDRKLTFLGLLKRYHIPQKTYYNMDQEDKELIQEIRAGQHYTVIKKKGKVIRINIPISDELMLEIKKQKKGYSAKYLPLPYDVVEKTISIRIKQGLHKDLHRATNSWYYGKEIEEVYSKALPLKKMKKGDKIIMFYTQKYRNGKVFSSPKIQACMIEINKKPYYGFLLNDEKYYDSLGKKYKRTYHSKFIRPLKYYKRVSSGFTYRRYHPILRRYRAHLGIDYAARTGRPVRASAKGKIVYRGWKGGYGRTIEIQHANGVKTLYAHMRAFAKGIKRGKYVAQGRVIGYVGTSGRSTGPHLHFGLYKHGRAKNPAPYIRKKTAKVIKVKGKEYKKLRKLVRKFRPQFKEAKKKIIVKERSEDCLNCVKKLKPRV